MVPIDSGSVRNDPVLASEDDSRAMDALRFSLASDIVELVVLTVDEPFLQTLREAVGPSRRLWHVLSSDKVGDLLLAGGVGILVLDVQALRQAGALFISQIKHQFPDLVIVVAGTRDAETELARLISDGTVYRFIHKPMSPARARLFADAAVKRYDEQRRRTGETTAAAAKPAQNGRLMIAVGCAAICAIAGGLWAVTRGDRGTSGPAAPAGTVAADTASASLTSEPRAARAAAAPDANADAGSDGAADRERLLVRAQNALLEERLDEAAAAIETARRAGADSGRISLLAAELAKARGQIKAAAAAARSNPEAATDGTAPAADPAEQSAALAMQRIREGRFVEPERDNARFYVQEALKSNPESDAAERASEALALGLLSAARGAIDRGDFKAASGWLDAADGVASSTNVDNLRHLLATAERQADEANAAPKPAEQPPREDRSAGDDGRANAAAAPVPSATGVIDASQLVLVKSVQPEYPRNAREGAIEGWVELDFTVAESGRVRELSVRAANPRGVFDQAAISALSQWRYKPVLVDAKPVAQRARIRIRFALAG
jgi:TonB family protein